MSLNGGRRIKPYPLYTPLFNQTTLDKFYEELYQEAVSDIHVDESTFVGPLSTEIYARNVPKVPVLDLDPKTLDIRIIVAQTKHEAVEYRIMFDGDSSLFLCSPRHSRRGHPAIVKTNHILLLVTRGIKIEGNPEEEKAINELAKTMIKDIENTLEQLREESVEKNKEFLNRISSRVHELRDKARSESKTKDNLNPFL